MEHEFTTNRIEHSPSKNTIFNGSRKLCKLYDRFLDLQLSAREYAGETIEASYNKSLCIPELVRTRLYHQYGYRLLS